MIVHDIDGKIILARSKTAKLRTTVVKMELIDAEWYIYDTLGNVEDQHGPYRNRLGSIKYFVDNNFVKEDGKYLPIVFAVTPKTVARHLNELEFNKYFKHKPTEK